jgi:hypothetical protein
MEEQADKNHSMITSATEDQLNEYAQGQEK